MIGRIFGVAVFVIAALYLKSALAYEASFGDPLGPRAFPLMLAIPALLGSASLVVYPGTSEAFAAKDRMWVQSGAVICLFAFVFLLERLGFLISTAGMVILLALLMQARPFAACATGVVASPALWLLFDKVLDLPLPMVGDWIG
ncbi:tripartite tricarboxylate transporter TctB family protein [Roseovarius sp. CAU 1744]|uniref:tripartite tricarboxylate transporter TctB family protein n=1 Tax=Roseovarius sp. CAU 1744 TaxID=3140368 RepID=UPI00325B735B